MVDKQGVFFKQTTERSKSVNFKNGSREKTNQMNSKYDLRSPLRAFL